MAFSQDRRCCRSLGKARTAPKNQKVMKTILGGAAFEPLSGGELDGVLYSGDLLKTTYKAGEG